MPSVHLWRRGTDVCRNLLPLFAVIAVTVSKKLMFTEGWLALMFW